MARAQLGHDGQAGGKGEDEVSVVTGDTGPDPSEQRGKGQVTESATKRMQTGLNTAVSNVLLLFYFTSCVDLFFFSLAH